MVVAILQPWSVGAEDGNDDVVDKGGGVMGCRNDGSGPQTFLFFGLNSTEMVCGADGP